VSKPVRIYDHTYAEIEALARTEQRSIANMIQVLLGEALAVRDGSDSGAAVGDVAVSGAALTPIAGEPERAAPEVKTDFKPGCK